MKHALNIIAGSMMTFIVLSSTAMYGLAIAGYFEAPQPTIIIQKSRARAYNYGLIRDLEHLKMDYDKADDNGKVIIRNLDLKRFAGFDPDSLESSLRAFYLKLRSDHLAGAAQWKNG